MTAPADVPMLPPGCGSWVVTSPDGRVFELYDKVNVVRSARAGWKIETTLDYLVRVNAQIATGAEK